MNALNVHNSKSLDFQNSGFVLVKNDFIQGYRFSVFLPNIYSLLKKMLNVSTHLGFVLEYSV